MQTTQSKPTLCGYWQTFDVNLPSPDPANPLAGYAPTFPLAQVPTLYNEVAIAFVVQRADGSLGFVGPTAPTAEDVRTLHAQGQRVTLSIGGAGERFALSTPALQQQFVREMLSLINQLGVDGLDIDIEQGLEVAGTPLSPIGPVRDLIVTLRELLSYLPSHFSLSFAPETVNVISGQTRFGGVYGNYLPLLIYFRPRLSYVQMQYYNSGAMHGLDGREYTAGTVEFITHMTQVLTQGFLIADTGVYFLGIPPQQLRIGLPAAPMAASNGYLDNTQIQLAYNQLHRPPFHVQGIGSMTWSVNFDRMQDYAFARNIQSIFANDR